MEVMGEAIARRDSDTNIHNYRVTLYTILLAQAMRYPNDQMSALVAGAFLHDVGKIGIPDAILLKPGKLTDDEFVIMKTHVSIGAQILARASWLASARDIPQYHHEKYDGSGYMSGLVGEAIPLSARIFAVVDVFDALTADRPYKKAMPLEQALSILQQGAGSHFDPKIVTIFSQYAAIWYQQIYQQSEEDVEKALRQQVTQIFSA
jgi:HD-GYP domain-containing protein (c-di-GMP phosphodiesterase class II)